MHISSSKPPGTNRLNFLHNGVSVGVIKLAIITIIIIIIIIITAIEFSLGGSSSYACTDKTNKNKYT